MFRGDHLNVRVLETARNGCTLRGMTTRDFVLAVGEEFRIGETWFRLSAGGPELTKTIGTAVLEQRYTQDELRRFRFDNASERLELLAGLPQLIANSRSDVDLAARLVEVLIEAIPQADAAAVVVMPVAVGAAARRPRAASSPIRCRARCSQPRPLRPNRRLCAGRAGVPGSNFTPAGN